jgi:tetrahydroxynaphthalene reductase
VISISGVESFGHISEITPKEIDRVLAVNTKGQLLVAQQAYKYLTPGGRLVMLSSISAQAKSIKNHALYSGSKAAVEAFVVWRRIWATRRFELIVLLREA